MVVVRVFVTDIVAPVIVRVSVNVRSRNMMTPLLFSEFVGGSEHDADVVLVYMVD